MRERYFVGVDGGATKTRAVVCNAALSVLGSGLAGPSNHHVLGLDKSREHIQSAIQAALEAQRSRRNRWQLSVWAWRALTRRRIARCSKGHCAPWACPA